jgi:hypothetical protein
LPENEIGFFKNTRYYNTKMPKVRGPYNSLDTFTTKVNEQLGPDGTTAYWLPSKYCDKTFIVMLCFDGTETEFHLRFYPDRYEMTARFPEGASDKHVTELTSIMKNKLDQCIYY